MINYLWRSVIDTTLLLLFISVLIRALLNKWWFISPYIIAGLIFFIIYLLGVAFRVGNAWEIMNQNIKDDSIRRLYGMNPYAMRDYPIRMDTIGLVFKMIFLISAVVLFITQIVF